IRAASVDELPCLTFVPSGEGESRVVPDPGTIAISTDPRERLATTRAAFEMLTEPVGDGAGPATFALIRAARTRATIFLCGHGADELLGGYRLSQSMARLRCLWGAAFLPGPWLDAVLHRYANGDESARSLRLRLRRAGPHRISEAVRFLINRPLPAADYEEIAGSGPVGALAVVDRLYAEQPFAAPDLDRLQNVMIQTFLSANILTYGDSMGMASSAELRMPYLDRDLVDFIFGLPPGARVGPLPVHSGTKRILRQWARGKVARSVLRRKKRSFQGGSVRSLLEANRGAICARILDHGDLRNALPGLEQFLQRPVESYRGPAEGTLWSVLALGFWSSGPAMAPTRQRTSCSTVDSI
ncbi:MAG: asparagine synthase, partial [Candidatus Eisenbacteria bacterium]|nr:asparagine synthase [Candidatus Eisenbacteria bacterium]